MGVEKWTDADKKEYEDNKVILKTLKNLTERVTGLEAEVAALRVETEQMKQNAQHETIQIGDITLPSDDAEFLLALYGVTKDTFIELLGHEKALNASFLWGIATARKSNDANKEKEVLNDYAFVIKNADLADFKFDTENAKMLISEIHNKSWNEIVQMIRQMINGTTLQNENHGQATKQL